MSGAATLRRRSGIVAPTILTLALLAGLVSLGDWQLHRKVWKEALIDTLDRRLAAAPAVLPAPADWPQLTADADEFRRVRFQASFLPQQEALVFTGGSALRPDVSGPGYWVFAPARLPDGAVVVVDRGFIPEGRQDALMPAQGEIGAPVEMVGFMRWPEQPGWFTPPPDPGRKVWFARDQRAMAAASGWGEVAPFYIDLESPTPPGGLPLPGPLKVNLPDDHLQYAITWFTLAAALAGTFGFWLWGRRRDSKRI